MRSLRARNLADKTVRTYADSTRALLDYTGAADVATIDRGQLGEFIVDQLSRYSPSTVSVRYRALQLFAWLAEEEYIDASPMVRMRPPGVPEIPIDVLSVDQQKAVVAICKGKTFVDRRDNAIARLFLGSGLRLAEMTGLRVEDVDDELDVRHPLRSPERHPTVEPRRPVKQPGAAGQGCRVPGQVRTQRGAHGTLRPLSPVSCPPGTFAGRHAIHWEPWRRHP